MRRPGKNPGVEPEEVLSPTLPEGPELAAECTTSVVLSLVRRPSSLGMP